MNLGNRVRVIHDDMMNVDLSPADVVIIYLETKSNEILRPKLEKSLRNGTRVISHDFAVSGWKPNRKEQLEAYSRAAHHLHLRDAAEVEVAVLLHAGSVASKNMVTAGNRKSIAVFIALGAIVVALAAALNVGWIIISWRTGLLLVSGVLLFGLIITGVVLNTIFLVREIRRNEQKDAFINAVTHELKTPSPRCALPADPAIAQHRRGETQGFYRIMLEDSDRLMATIEQVLHAGRTSARRKLLHRTPDRSPATGRRVCRDLAHPPPPRRRGAALRRQPASLLRRVVMGDDEELKAAILNLIDNAIKYSGPNVDVAVKLAKNSDGSLELRVKDKGVGIPEPELKRIFNRFYRIPGAVAARVKGTGLGLFIVQSIVKQHGGRAFAESEGAGRGSTFTIELPLAPADEPDPDRRRRVAHRRGPALQPRGRRLRGDQCRYRRGGRRYWPTNKSYDLVVLDVMLPGMSGFDVARQLRDAGKFVPILMLTARGRPEDVLGGFAAGADDYLPKPFELPSCWRAFTACCAATPGCGFSRRSPPPHARASPISSSSGQDDQLQHARAAGRRQTVPLTLMEANLLRYLIRHQGKAVSRKAMLEDVWGVREDTDTRAIDNFIVRLRRYIEENPIRRAPAYRARRRLSFLPEP